MKVWLLNTQGIFALDLSWGFKQMGCDVKISLPRTIEVFKTELEAYEPDLVMTFGSPACYKNIDLLEEIGRRKPTKTKYIHWDTDGISWAADYELPLIERTKPDITFTHCPDMYHLLKKQGIRTSMLAFAFNPSIHYKGSVQSEYENMITYVGNSYNNILKNPNHYRTKSVDSLIGTLIQQGKRVDMWGDAKLMTWHKRWGVSELPKEWYHGTCKYEDTRAIYSSAFINIIPQNHPYHLTKRTFEIMGCGGFVLSYDIPEIRRLFVPGRDLVVASSAEEVIACIQDYSKKGENYKKIKENASKAIAGQTYKERAETILKEVSE